MAMHQAKQNSAMQKMQQLLQAQEQYGFPASPQALVKLAKQAGLHPPTKPEELQGLIDIGHGAAPGPTDPKTGKSSQTSQSSQRTGGPEAGAKAQVGAQPMSNIQSVRQGQLTKQQQQQQYLEHWATSAVQAAQQRGESAAKITQLHNQVTDLKSKALNGSPQEQQEAVGKLMSINEIPWTLDRQEWTTASPEQKQGIINMAAGYETDAQKQQRTTALMGTFMTSGKFTDPEAANKAATAIVHNQPIPADVRASMKPYTMTELTQQVQIMNDLVAAGVPPDRLASTMAAAEVNGIPNSLPTKITPIIVQELGIKKQELALQQQEVGIRGQELGIEQQRLKAEQAHYEADAAKVDVAAKLEQNKEFFSNFQALVMMKKQGGVDIPKEVEDSYMAQLADKSGLDVKEVNNWFHFITGGTHLEFTQKVAGDVSSAGAGKSQAQPGAPPTASSLGQFYKSAKKVGRKAVEAVGLDNPATRGQSN
jgi:hypothetical protein